MRHPIPISCLAASALAAVMILGLTISASAGAPNIDPEELIQSTPDPETFGRHLLYLTEEPHPTGTPRNM